MFCEKCGTAIDGDSVFCPECGALVRESNPADVTSKRQNGWIIGVSIAGGVLVLFLLIGVLFFANHGKYINLVKNGHPKLYPDTTYNEAFSGFFSEPKWEHFKSEEEGDIVEFRGKCSLLDSDVAVKMTIQFVVDEDDAAAEDEGDYYIFEDSDNRVLKNSELKGCDTEILRLGRNEIYARHGRRFLDEELQSYFDSMPWYEGTIEPEDFKESVLNKYEKKNLKKIARFENR